MRRDESSLPFSPTPILLTGQHFAPGVLSSLLAAYLVLLLFNAGGHGFPFFDKRLSLLLIILFPSET